MGEYTFVTCFFYYFVNPILCITAVDIGEVALNFWVIVVFRNVVLVDIHDIYSMWVFEVIKFACSKFSV